MVITINNIDKNKFHLKEKDDRTEEDCLTDIKKIYIDKEWWFYV